MIGTAEAAKRVGLSQRRIVALIHDGTLLAERVGGVWIVDEDSLSALKVYGRAGRPKKGDR